MSTTVVQEVVGPAATVEMKALHSAFRRELGWAAALVREVRPDDRARAAFVSRHLDLVERFLHHHHTLEDELLWPALLTRVPVEIAPVVELMESQHEVVDSCLARLGPLRERWERSPDPAVAEALAHLYERLHSALVEHLDAEESRVMPLVETSISRLEWEALGKAGQSALTGREGLVVFGAIQLEAGDGVVEQMLSTAPAPVRFLLPRLARRAYRTRLRRLGRLA